MLDLEQRQRCARVRAARAYAGLKQGVLADLSGVSFDTLRRIEQEKRAPVLDDLRAIGDACGVPRVFMEQGWAAMSGPTSEEVNQRFAELERMISQIGAGRQELLAEVGVLVGKEVARALRAGHLPRAAEDDATENGEAPGEGRS